MSVDLTPQADDRELAGPKAGGLLARWGWPSPAISVLVALLLVVGAGVALRAHAVPSAAIAAVGSRAPEFNLPVLGHPTERLSLSSLHGHTIVVVFNCGCKACDDFDRCLAAAGPRLGRARVIAVTTNPSAYAGAKLSRFRRVTGFEWPVVVDSEAETTMRYQSSECPIAWLIDSHGVIQYGPSSPGDLPTQAVDRLLEACRAL